MDSAVNWEEAQQSGPIQSDGPISLVGEKRPLENGGDAGLELEARLSKRPRVGALRRVAEIVLVLSTMAEIRGGKKPTEVEVGLIAEARAKLVELCEGLAPMDIVARDAIGAVIEDLGLNGKVKEQKLGFRRPRLTIAERFSQTKRKMEETRKYAAQSSPHTSNPLQTNFNTAAENRGNPHTLRTISSDKQSHQPISSGGTSGSLPPGHVATATPTSAQYQLPTNDVRATVSSGFPNSNLVRDSSSSALPRVERTHFKLDRGPNGSSYASQGQVNSSSSNHHPVNAPTWSVQTQAAKSGPEQNKPPNHTSAKVDGTAQMSVPRVTPLAPRDQNFRPFITQPAAGNLPSMHQPLHAMNSAQASSVFNSHNEIAKAVQELLQPKLLDHPTWIPPSRDYMNKALTCQICQHTINEVDNVLICDACEKGYHIKCALSFNQRTIPRGEWHCSMCLALSNGKPLPPKYGRVMRSNTPVKIPSSAAAVQSSTEKKVGNVDPKVNQQKITANGSSDLQIPTHTGSVALGSNIADLATDSKSPNFKETEKTNVTSISKNLDLKFVLENCANTSMKSSEAAVGSSAVDSSKSSSQLVKSSEPLTRQEESVDFKPLPVNNLSETGVNNKDSSQTPADSCVVNQAQFSNSTEIASEKSQDSNAMVKDRDKSHLNESLDCTSRFYIKRDEQDVALANTIESSATSSGVVNYSGHCLGGLCSVQWIGNVNQVVDEKNFYQCCSIDGVSHKVHDHALFRSSRGKLIPSKLQSMWEDSKTGSKWVIVNRCYFPGDLPENVGRPCTTDSNEVYESNHNSTVMAGLIQGSCEVLPPSKFKAENKRQSVRS